MATAETIVFRWCVEGAYDALSAWQLLNARMLLGWAD